MALSRAEIELLIKARNEAQGAFDQLNKQVKSVTGESNKASQGMTTLEGKTKGAGIAAGATGVAFGLLAERLGRGLVSAFGETIAAANRLDGGLIGLGATARAFGTDAGAAQEAARSLASDGLMSVGEAAAGLKNLLAGGFNLPQAIELMNRFKDSAAFGRQGSLEFGQAIVGATEGIKNGNSALVDNAGLTKNLSNILVEAGFSAQDLSKVQSDLNVRTALYNGILKETNPQLGQTAIFLDTAAGKQTQFNSQVEIAQQKIGKALQPALVSTLGALTPFIAALGDAAPILVTLGATAAAFAIPLAAIRAGAALGIPNIVQLGTSMKNTLAVFQGAKSLADARAGIQLVGESAGLTTANLGKMGTAVAVVGAAFIGWQIGTVIDQLTGASGAIERWAGSANRAALAAQTSGAALDVINRAIAQGAPATIRYTEAIEFNQRVMAIRVATLDKTAAAQRAGIDAELAMGRITLETANARRSAIEADERALQVSQARVRVADVVANAEKAFRAEIQATGLSVGELQTLLKTNEAGFEAYSKQVQLSDATVKRLKDGLKETEEQQKKNKEATEKQTKAQKELREELENTAGVITQAGLNEKLAKMQQLLDMAAKQGTPALKVAVQALWPEFEKLAAQAKASNLEVGKISDTMNTAATSAGLVLPVVRQFNQFIPAMAGVTEANRVNTAEVRVAIKTQENLAEAYRHFGITAPADLVKVADESRRNFEVLRASGMATTDQLKAAYRRMVDDQKAATQEVPTFWEKHVFPGVSRTISTLQTAVQGSFAQMLLGAKGFGEGFGDIWKSIKASTLQVLSEILSAFLNQFLKGLLGAMSGQQNAFSTAFGGLFGGGGAGGVAGAGGGGGFNLSSLLGLGGGGGGAAAGGAGGAGGATGGAAGGGGLFGGLSAAGIAGGAGAAGAGIGLGMLGKNIFGGAGFKASGFGAGSGAATGALIGSVVPGLGTAVGAIVGGLAGAITGWLGKSREDKGRDQFIGQFGGAGTGEGSGFANLAAELAKLSEAAGGGAGGGSLFQNLLKADNLREFEAAVTAIQTALANAAQTTTDTTAATDALTDAVTDVAAAEADLAATRAAGSDAALAGLDSQRVALEAQLLEQTRLMEQMQINGQVGTDEMARVEVAIQTVEAALVENRREADRVEQGIRDLGQTTRGVADNMARNLDGVERDFRAAAAAAFGAADQIEGAFGGLSFRVPVSFDVAEPNMPDFGGGGDAGGEGLPMAAKGVMADKASLVVFGEGGEAEVGGPRSFFRDVFEQLAKEGVGMNGGGGDGNTFVFPITAMSGSDVTKAIETQVLPNLLNVLRQNRAGSLTNLKQILGVK